MVGSGFYHPSGHKGPPQEEKLTAKEEATTRTYFVVFTAESTRWNKGRKEGREEKDSRKEQGNKSQQTNRNKQRKEKKKERKKRSREKENELKQVRIKDGRKDE